jgi:hypothetical protein
MWFNKQLNKNDNYYSVLMLTGNGMEALRQLFPDCSANDLNMVLFSTGGIHGTYCTIEDVEKGMNREEVDCPRQVTFIVIHPRIVCLRYGNAEPKNTDDIEWLKNLRASSLCCLAGVGIPG